MRKSQFDIQVYTKNSPLTRKQIELYLQKLQKLLPEIKKFFITVAIIDDVRMRELNFRFTGRNKTTDVLSFFYDDFSPTVEVIVSSDQAIINAPRYRNTPARELLTYLVHGILHALGYDDSSQGERKKMFAKQRGILRALSDE